MQRKAARRAQPAPADPDDAGRGLVERVRAPLRPGDPRRHHFIPQFVLRSFADEAQQLVVTPVGDPTSRSIRGVANVAVVKDLYTVIDTEVGETVAIEKILATADEQASRAINTLVSHGPATLPPEDRAAFMVWLGLLQVRDPFSRRRAEAMFDFGHKLDLSLASDPEVARIRLRGDGQEEPDPAEVAALAKAASELDHIEVSAHQNELIRMMLTSGTGIGEALLSRRIAVLRFPGRRLVLCDRPILLYQRPENRSPWMGVGPATADELWLPLDRRTLLILHDGDDVGDFITPAPPGVTIDGINQALVSTAASEVYCHPSDVGRIDCLQMPSGDQPLLSVSGADWANVSSDGVNAPPKRTRPRRYRSESSTNPG